MQRPHPVYRALVRLYPSEFRRSYGDDLVQHFADLVRDRGPRAAWTRTGVDLIITVPRYRLELVMNEQHTATALNGTIILLALAGVASLLTGMYPGMAFLALAAVLGFSQRSTIARAIRVPSTSRRRRRLTTSAVLTVVFVSSYLIFLQVIGDTWTVRETVLAIIGNGAMVGAGVYLIIGLLTPRSSGAERQGSKR